MAQVKLIPGDLINNLPTFREANIIRRNLPELNLQRTYERNPNDDKLIYIHHPALSHHLRYRD